MGRLRWIAGRRGDGRRAATGSTAVAAVAAAGALGAGVFAAVPMSSASTSPSTTTSTLPMAGVVTPKSPIRPHKGKSFIPILGNWEGTANGFPASFDLRYDPKLPARRGVPQYGITQLVTLRPSTCPVTRSRYRETLVTGRIPTEIGGFGSLGLTRFGFAGSFAKGTAAALSAHYRSGSCSGTQVWHMRPVMRSQVDDGMWRLQFRDGESDIFDVQAGGRLATSIKLPQALTACNGIEGNVDLFIAANGQAQLSQRDVRVTMSFSRKTASGQLDAGGRGCSHGPIHFTAKTL
jgi:hypothetical protein